MAKRLRLSETATEQMYRVQQRLNLEKRDKLWTLRIALARSLQTQAKPQSEGAFSKKEARGFEIDLHTLEQKDGLILKALLQQYYHQQFDEGNYAEYVLWHIEHGLDVIDQETANFSGYEYLVELAKSGLRASKDGLPAHPTEDTSERLPEGFKDILSLRIGVEKETGEPNFIKFNKTDEHNNNYIGIMGRPGSGKTYFGKHFLRELRKASKYKTHYIIFDYAKGDIANDLDFVQDTRAEVIPVHKQPIPINVFRESTSSYQDRKFTAERIVEIVRNVEAHIGKKQENNLYEAIVDAYEDVMYGDNPYPDFQLVRHKLEEINPNPDSLTSVFRPLTEHNLFAERTMPVWDSLVDRTVIFDIHKLPALKDLCVFLVLNELYRQLMALPDSKVDPVSKVREMRTVIVLDEAHHFLKSKKRVGILENLIREIRSKGASVMLLSQSPDDYDHADFNFLELLEFVYVLGCNPSSYKFLQQTFGVSPDRAKQIMCDVTALNQGEAFGKAKAHGVVKLGLCG